MMMNKLFNSVFENALRLIILLDEFNSKQSLDMIYVADFMVSYGLTFDVSEVELNGDNKYKFSEFASRRETVRIALKELVVDGLVIPINSEEGIRYTITEAGHIYSKSLSSEYSEEYRNIAKKVVDLVSGKSERIIIKQINKMSTESICRGNV